MASYTHVIAMGEISWKCDAMAGRLLCSLCQALFVEEDKR